MVEEALASLLGFDVVIIGASRTDAGVHARGQVAHVALPRPFPERGLVHGTNHYLPEDIRVLAAARMPADFHARRWARAKEYVYRLVAASVISPLDAPFATRVDPGLDVEAMRQAAGRLLGRHDFAAFALAGGDARSTVRTLLVADWTQHGPRLAFRVVGDAFLRGMVRALVGTLLEVGRGRRSAASVARLLAGVPRSQAGPTAPSQGLTLERVLYDQLEAPERPR